MATENERIWYSDALEVLHPLRWHLNELIQEMESYNRFAKRTNSVELPEQKITEAKAALTKAEKFLTSSK